MRTVLQEIMSDLRQTPMEMCSQKSIADWIEAVYLEKEKYQIISTWDNGFYSGVSGTNKDFNKSGFDYYNETFKNEKQKEHK